MAAAAFTMVRDPYAPTERDRMREQRMIEAWQAYQGRFRGGTEQWPLLWETGREPNPNVIINRCGPAVDTDVAWLMGESVTITLKDASKDAPDEAQEYADQVWGVTTDDSSDDDKMALLQELATNGAITGHAFLKIVWDEAASMEFPELVVLDSTMVRVRTAPHNAKVPICYIIEYKVSDPNDPNGGMATFRQVTELVDRDGEQKLTGRSDPDDYWTITDYLKPANGQQFVMQGEPQKWPYTWAPIDSCPHLVWPNQFYGRPRITPDVIHINESICTVASNINKIGMRYGTPVLYTIKAGNNQASLKYQPGTIMQVSNDVKAVEAHGDLANLMQFEADLRADFDEETHVPASAFGRITTEGLRLPQSGTAIRLGYLSLISDIMKEQRTYGALIRRVTQHLLELKNASWAKFTVTLGWQDPLPSDDLMQAQVVQIADGVGVISKRTGATKLGLDWEVEQQNMQEEQQATLDAFAKGQGFPSAQPQPTQPAEQQPGQAQQQNTPPVNHPAAVAARATMSQAMQNAGGQS